MVRMVPAALVLASVMFVAADTSERFTNIGARTRASGAPVLVDNPLSWALPAEVRSIAIRAGTNLVVVVTNRHAVAVLQMRLREARFRIDYMTLGQPGYLSVQDYLDARGKVMASIAVNTPSGEVVLLSCHGKDCAYPVVAEAPKYARAVYDVIDMASPPTLRHLPGRKPWGGDVVPVTRGQPHE